MTYRKPKPAPKCCVCRNTLYSRGELPSSLEALCFACLSERPLWNGPVLKRIEPRAAA